MFPVFYLFDSDPESWQRPTAYHRGSTMVKRSPRLSSLPTSVTRRASAVDQVQRPQAEPARSALARPLKCNAIHIPARRPGREKPVTNLPFFVRAEIDRPQLPLVASTAQRAVNQSRAIGAEAGMNALRGAGGDGKRFLARRCPSRKCSRRRHGWNRKAICFPSGLKQGISIIGIITG